MIVWLLKTLEKNPASVFRKKDLLRKSKEQFEKLKTQGFLTYSQPDPHHETYPCTLQCSNGCPMDVVNMEGKHFAICPEDTEVDPIPLTKDDITRYHLSLKMLIKAIRESNDFAGDTYSLNPHLHFIGEHIIEGINTAFILALFPNVQAAEPHLLSLPSRIPTNYKQIVIVTPSLSLTKEPIYAKLRNASIFPITLTSSFGQRNFKINYLDVVRKCQLAGIRPGDLQKTEQVMEDELVSLTAAGLKNNEKIPPHIDIEGLWSCPNLDKLREIDSNAKRDGIADDKQTLKRLKEYLTRRRKRKDIAETLYFENGRIKTSMPCRSMFKQK